MWEVNHHNGDSYSSREENRGEGREGWETREISCCCPLRFADDLETEMTCSSTHNSSVRSPFPISPFKIETCCRDEHRKQLGDHDAGEWKYKEINVRKGMEEECFMILLDNLPVPMDDLMKYLVNSAPGSVL